ncbi:hypothetical protein EV182_001467, partial [Spiromyces aspiralis]
QQQQQQQQQQRVAAQPSVASFISSRSIDDHSALATVPLPTTTKVLSELAGTSQYTAQNTTAGQSPPTHSINDQFVVANRQNHHQQQQQQQHPRVGADEFGGVAANSVGIGNIDDSMMMNSKPRPAYQLPKGYTAHLGPGGTINVNDNILLAKQLSTAHW